ncbi:MAG: TRAM domain-containing protein [Dehalococcoidia bacterium]|nr:TRAM domain-containing protein [Dehalococcoidia bacterium]
MPDDVPAEVKSERLQRVNAIEERISREINESLLGATQEILVEGVSMKGQHYGRTRTGKLVHLDAPARPGALVDVHIDHAGPFALRGTAVDALAVV